MRSEKHPHLETTTIGQWQARQIVKAANILSLFVESTQEDKLRWQPAIGDASKTQSVLEQVGECIVVNNRWLSLLKEEAPAARPEKYDTFASAQEAIVKLKESARAVADYIAQMDHAALAKEYSTHRGIIPGALIIQFPLRNMTYHMGQVNMTQLLYGDTEFHIDDEFITL